MANVQISHFYMINSFNFPQKRLHCVTSDRYAQGPSLQCHSHGRLCHDFQLTRKIRERAKVRNNFIFSLLLTALDALIHRFSNGSKSYASASILPLRRGVAAPSSLLCPLFRVCGSLRACSMTLARISDFSAFLSGYAERNPLSLAGFDMLADSSRFKHYRYSY